MKQGRPSEKDANLHLLSRDDAARMLNVSPRLVATASALRASVTKGTAAPELERKIDELTDDLEPDERETYEMISDKLGDFANTPLGQAALAAARPADGDATLQSVGA